MASFPLPAPSLCLFCTILQPKRNGTADFPGTSADFPGTSADFPNKLSRGGHGCLHCGQPFRPKPHNAVMPIDRKPQSPLTSAKTEHNPVVSNGGSVWRSAERHRCSASAIDWSVCVTHSGPSGRCQTNAGEEWRRTLVAALALIPQAAGWVTHATTTQDRIWGFGSPWCTCMQAQEWLKPLSTGTLIPSAFPLFCLSVSLWRWWWWWLCVSECYYCVY